MNPDNPSRADGSKALDIPATSEASGEAMGRRAFLGRAAAVGGAAALLGASPALASVPSLRPRNRTSPAVGAGKTIAICLNVANAYASYVAEGVLEALEGTGYKVRTVVNNADATTELSNIENLISTGISGLVILPVNAQTAAKGAQLCYERGIAYGNALWPGASAADKYFTGVAFVDSTKGGVLIGDYLKTNAKPGKMIVVQGILGQGFSEFIDAGLNSSLAGTKFDIVVRQQGFYSTTTAANIVETGLAAHPDVTAIVTYAASMGDGVASLLKSKGLSHITHVSSDCDETLVKWLKTPYCAATRYYSAAESGLKAATAVRAKLEGGSPIFLNRLKEEMVTGDTIDAERQSLPFDYPKFAAKVAGL